MDRPAQIKFPIPEEELLYSGHTACPGCGAALAMKYVLKGLGPRTIIVIPPSCAGTIAAGFPFSSLKVPVLRIPFESTAITASGIRAALDVMGKEDIHVLAWAGDGGTFDIGLQALSGSAERNDNIIYVCYDNEGYMNTGIQRSSSTPTGAWTTTTPAPYVKDTPKKDIVRIMAAHNIPYIATASIGYPADLIRKVKKAKEMGGTKFILIFSPCPTGWRYSPEMTIRLAKLATETGIFPLYEIENGEKYTLSSKRSEKPLRDYLALQGRFRNLTEENLRRLEERVEKEREYLKRLAG
ncbi:MAG: thiamine pyrophosphate-dependent enzyme [Syntrophales bacterium]|jgi:pyruvate/2-oxoacid:ferredoxin oxidoreductase beta subunit